MFNFSTTIPLSLYIHFPWCVRKCPYCDFNSHTLREEIPEEAYIDALIDDLDKDLPKIWGRRLISIFMGGGTPSLFSAKALDRLLNALRSRISFAPDTEITLEANPGTVEQRRFAEYRDAGINRLSIGIQSLQEDKLQALGRIHNVNEAINAATVAHDAGFSTFNLDLMYGLPKQSLEDALYDLEQALSLNPTHLSWYQLTLEPNTLFYRHPPKLPEHDALWEIQQKGALILSTRGFENYEISAYSKPKHQCRHNINYWEYGDYLGIGAGAHSKITDPSTQTVTRTIKAKHPKDYLNPEKTFVTNTQTLNAKDVAFEFMLNNLRLCKDIDIRLFQERTGLPISIIEPNLIKAQKDGLLNWDEFTIQPTDKGRRFLNDLQELFF